MEIVERYNELLRTSENEAIKLLNRVLEGSFNRLVRRARVHIKAGQLDKADRSAQLLQEFRQLIPVIRPDKVDGYDRIFRSLLTTSGKYGTTVAENLSSEIGLNRVDVAVPLEATYAAAANARGYLRKHGEKFATTSAEIVAQGIAEGSATDEMVMDMRSRLGVVQSRAEVIVRTESLRAYNEASNNYYSAQGINTVMYYATADDRSCPVCAPRAGMIYKRSEIKTPLHPRCRCYLAPFDQDLAVLDPEYNAMRLNHRAEVSEALKRYRDGSFSLNRAGVFEQLAPTPLVL